MKEKWKALRSYGKYAKELYEISNLGSVRTVKERVVVDTMRSRWGGKLVERRRVYPPRVLKLSPLPSGHLTVQINTGPGEARLELVHRLVAFTWIGKPPEGKYLVRHENDIPNDNNYRNLLWGDDCDNMQDSIRNGRVYEKGRTKKTHAGVARQAESLAKSFVLFSPTGRKYKGTNVADFCNKHDLPVSSVYAVLGGNKLATKSGWTGHYIKKIVKKDSSK